jgi:hypothetical protein
VILKTEKQTIELVFSTKKIIQLTDELKGKNLSDLYFKALANSDIKSLAKIIFQFGEFEGKSPFNNDLNRVYDFLDQYKKENNKSYEEIYKEIAEVINEEGFFPKKMTKEELTAMFDNPMSSIDMEATMKSVVEKVAAEVVTQEFKGHQA